jgi:hypothetical protein
MIRILLGFLVLVGCGTPEDRCILDDHPPAITGAALRVEGCAVAFPKSGQWSSWVDLNGAELRVAFYDACKIGETIRSVRLTNDERKLFTYRSADRSGVITMPRSNTGTLWMDLTVEVTGSCATTAEFTVYR